MDMEQDVEMQGHTMLQQLIFLFLQRTKMTLPKRLEMKLKKRRKRNAKRWRGRFWEEIEKEAESEEKEWLILKGEQTLKRLKLEKDTLRLKYEKKIGNMRKKRFVHHSKEKLRQLISTKWESGLEEHEVEGKGRCVFATRFFNQGEFVCQYLGEYITLKEGKDREAEYEKDPSIGSFMFFVGQGRSSICIDATAEAPGMGRLISHSRLLPNLVSKCETIGGVQHVYFRALEDIFPGEELKYDYGEHRQEVLDDLPWLPES